MPRGQKTCPKCNNGVGPRTKVCDKCGHIFIFDKKDKEKEENIDEDLQNIDQEARTTNNIYNDSNCIWCGRWYRGYSNLPRKTMDHLKDDPHEMLLNNIINEYNNYCGVCCIIDSCVRIKDKVLIKILKELKNRNLNLKDFIPIELFDNKSKFLLRDLLIKDYNDKYVYNSKRTLTLDEDESEFENLELGEENEDLLFSLEQAIGSGLRIPPRIEDVREIQNKEVEELSEGAEILRRLRNKNKGIIEETEEIEEEEIEEEKPSPQSSLMSRLLNKQSEVKPVISNTNTKPGRGQKKCARCGSIVGVRTKVCSCGYQF